MKSHRTPKFAEELLKNAKDPGIQMALKKGLGRILEPASAPEDKKEGKVSIRVSPPRKTPQTEIEYGAILRGEFPGCRVEHEKWSLRLPGGIRYSPDFTVWTGARLELAVEVKGPFRLQSSARSYAAFKIAIEGWPQIIWRFAEKQASGEWAVRDYNT